MNTPLYCKWSDLKAEDICLALGTERNGKPTIRMFVGTNAADVAFMTPACVTHWPRCTGNGNFGTMWGPTELVKARFTLDLTDFPINGTTNNEFEAFAALMEAIDDKLLDFVHNEQIRILGRRSLSKEEVKMLQVRSVRSKYDRNTGALCGHSINLTAPKFVSDGMGGKYERKISVCDYLGNVVHGNVCPGDVVAATMHISTIYTGMGGDKFGISWGFDSVAVVCQRTKMEARTSVPIFANLPNYDFAMAFDPDTTNLSDTFSDQ